MRCRYCKRDLPDNAMFCCWCGREQSKPRKKKEDISIPKARQLRSGAWNIELRAEGISVTEATRSRCEAKARAIREGFIAEKKAAPKMTVDQLIDDYISSKSNVLSPSTVRGYKSYRNTHFADIGGNDCADVNWQRWVNDKSSDLSPKTISNLWRLVTASLKLANLEVPSVTLPSVPKPDEQFLDHAQIETFVEALRSADSNTELVALLALHSLRRSEIMALTPANIDRDNKVIHVRGACVQDEDNRLVYKKANKSNASTRDIPIMIPRLLELIPESGDGYLVTCHPNRMTERIHTVCRRAGLPLCGLHDLRRSMASLAYHLGWDERTLMRVGGWSDIATVHKFYVKLAQRDVDEHTKSMSDFYNFTNAIPNAIKKRD